MLRELGCCASCALGWSTSRGKSRICWTNLYAWVSYAWVSGDAASEHCNSAGQYCHAACWNCDTASRNGLAANHSWFHLTRRNPEYHGAGLEFPHQPHTGRHYPAVNHQPQHAEQSRWFAQRISLWHTAWHGKWIVEPNAELGIIRFESIDLGKCQRPKQQWRWNLTQQSGESVSAGRVAQWKRHFATGLTLNET
jgi:hypothetical protein